MEDVMIGSGIFVAAVSVWFVLQTGVWLLSLPIVGDVTRVRNSLIAFAILAPFFVFGMLLTSGLTSGDLDGWSLVLLPFFTASAGVISWLGLKVALQIKRR